MKTWKYSAVAALLFAAIISFFLPCKSYYFPPGHLVIDRPIEMFPADDGWGALIFLVFFCPGVFTPAMVFVAVQTRLERNLPALAVVSLISSVLLFFAIVGFRVAIFATQVRLFFGFYLIVGLGAIGCLGFWILTLREIWHRSHHWSQKRDSHSF